MQASERENDEATAFYVTKACKGTFHLICKVSIREFLTGIYSLNSTVEGGLVAVRDISRVGTLVSTDMEQLGPMPQGSTCCF